MIVKLPQMGSEALYKFSITDSSSWSLKRLKQSEAKYMERGQIEAGTNTLLEGQDQQVEQHNKV